MTNTLKLKYYHRLLLALKSTVENFTIIIKIK